MREVTVSAETRAALAADLTIRCAAETKYVEECRHSSVIIAWTDSWARNITQVMLEAIGQPETSFNVQVIVIEMLRSRQCALLLYDVFLEGCNERFRREINEDDKRPVHTVGERRNVVHIHKAPEMIRLRAANRFMEMRELDKGPLPLFSDLQNPPLYDRGRRVEAALGEDPNSVFTDSEGPSDGGDVDYSTDEDEDEEFRQAALGTFKQTCMEKKGHSLDIVIGKDPQKSRSSQKDGDAEPRERT